jgi:uncharacterized membrane protein YeaQ/YmgE (transglycosylase-associated protein family)
MTSRASPFRRSARREPAARPSNRGVLDISGQGEDEVLGFLILLVIVGLVAGFIARAVVPGPDPMGIVGTIVLGIIGSFVGGFLGWALFGKDLDEGAFQASGIIGSIIGAIVALLVYRAVEGRGHRGLTH